MAGAAINAIAKFISNAMNGKKLSEGLGTAIVAGAASGALASTGVGIIGMAVGSAGISMAENAINQMVQNNGLKDFDTADFVVDGAVGLVSGAISGPGSGTKHMNNLGKQTIKRTINATKHKGLKAGFKESIKAFAYYGKSSASYYKEFASDFLKDMTFTAGSVIATSDYMKTQYYHIFGG